MKKTLSLTLIILILKLFVNDANAFMFWNQACKFNGGVDSSHVSIVNAASLNITGSFTIECWVNPTNVTTPNLQMILQKGSGTTGYSLLLNSGKVTIRTNSTPRLIGKTAIAGNQWTHIAGTYNSTTNVFTVYINGSPDTSVTIAGAIPTANTDSLFIGKGANSPFAGQMDEVRLWNRALSSAEINTNRRTTLGASGGIYNGIVFSMTFQDRKSTGSDFVLTDWSDNGNHGINRGVSAVDLNNRPSTTIAPNESIELDGTDDYLEGTDNQDVSPTSAITIEVWFRPRNPTLTNQTIVHKGPALGGANTSYRLRLDSGIIKVAINGTSGFTSGATLPSNQWSHAAFTYDGSSGEYKFYINGRLTNSGTNGVGNIVDGSDNLFIGGTTGLPDFDGFIDEVRISNYVKSQLQINKYLFQSIDKANEPNPAQTNVVYNLDGYSVDNADSGPRLYFRNNASFSHPGTTDNQPVSPLDRSNVLNFQDGFYLKSSGKLIGPTGITRDTLELFYDTIIHDINLFVALNHNDESNLEISLIAPNGEEIKVFDRNSLVANSDNIITIFDDQSDSSLNNGRYVSFGPSIKPANSMIGYIGDALPGKWILKINDQSGSESGRLYAWGLQVNNMPLKIPALKLKVVLQGMYNSSSSLDSDSLPDPIKQDDVKIILHQQNQEVGQYTSVIDNNIDPSEQDMPIGYFNLNGLDEIRFENSFIIDVSHRNSIRTYSSNLLPPTFDMLNPMAVYDMVTDISSAYGNNMIQVRSNPNWYAIYSGDVNQDGAVDLADISLIENAAANFLTGYVPEDLNGDGIVDLSDGAICDNNAFNFVITIVP